MTPHFYSRQIGAKLRLIIGSVSLGVYYYEIGGLIWALCSYFSVLYKSRVIDCGF